MSKNLLAVNFVTDDAENRKTFATACFYAECDVAIQLANEELKKVNKKLSAESIAVKEAEFLESQKQELENRISEFQTEMSGYESAFVQVVGNITEVGNNEEVAIRILRMIASAKNSKFMKFAVSGIQDESLYEALENIHILSEANENGGLKQTDKVRESYKAAKIRLETIIKERFSLPFANDFTGKVNVKLNSGDIKLIHDCYITGFRNKFNTDDDKGEITFKSRQINTLVRKKTNKKSGEATYDFTRLLTVIANIVISKYCK